jgi:hypothetical protein
MKKLILVIFVAFVLISFNSISNKNEIVKEVVTEKFDIKIKNDTNEVVQVINAGSGGSYSLSKNTVTTIKMEEGDKLHYYIKGAKKGLILMATKDMDGKVQLLSKL